MNPVESPAARRTSLVLRATIVSAIVVVVVIAFAIFDRAGVRANEQARPGAPSGAASVSTTRATLLLEDGATAPLTETTSHAWFIAQGAPPIRFSGHVYLDGHPAAGITVTATDELTSDGLLAPRTTVTDREGTFVLTSITRIRGGYRLAASVAGAASAWANVSGDAPTSDIELRLTRCTLHIYGTVSDASGGAVGAAKVFLENAPAQAVLSDAEGRFRICVPPRSGRLHVEAEGYGPWLRWLAPRGALRQDVTLIPAASIAGTVVLAHGGTEVPFALVTARTNGETSRSVQADAAGHFVIPNVTPGSYAVEARGPGARSQHPVDVAAFASAEAQVIVPVDTRARVHGRVVSKEGPVAGVSVNLGFNATFEWGTSARTDDDGAFTIEDAPIGNVLVKIDDLEIEAPRTLTVPETGIADVTLHVAPKAQLLVTVTREGSPVSDATVFVRAANASLTKTTSASGIATFRGLGEATYRVFTEHENDFAVAERVDVSRQSPTRIALELTAGRQIKGRVIDEQGRPLDGARVAFTLASSVEDGGASAITGPDGSFRGGPLRGPATYAMTVTRSGIALDPKRDFPHLTVPASGPVAPAELVLIVKTDDKSLGGHVVDAASGPVRDARVTVSRPERHADIVATTFSGNDGSFAFRSLGAGPWAVKATAASGSEAEVKPVTLPSRDLRIELPPVGAIRGTLKGSFARTPSVMAWGVAGYDWDFHPAVVESGRFLITGLSRGRYHVAASSSDAAAHVTVDVEGDAIVDVELVATGKRTIHGKTLDFASGKPIANMSCQAAPYVAGARSPVVVPGTVFSNDEGAFDLVDVPASDLYMWCSSDASFRGGVARMPSDLGDRPITVWGLDVRGQGPLDVKSLGLTMADDHPFSRQVAVVEPKGAAARAGVRVGDVFDTIGDKPLTEVGNGIVRNYLALLLTLQKRVQVVMSRGGTSAPLVFTLE